MVARTSLAVLEHRGSFESGAVVATSGARQALPLWAAVWPDAHAPEP